MSKEEMVNNIRQYVQLDNEIRQLNSEAKKRKDAKKSLTDKLVQIMKENDIDEFDINDGKLIYSQKKTKVPLTKKTLIGGLLKFYKNDKKMVEELSNFIMDNREEKVTETIRRKIDNQN